jgi:hypothetical protein
MSDEPITAVLEQTEPDFSKMYAALALAQAKFPVIKKNRTAKVKSKRTGETFEYQYCTLDAILDAVRPPLAANGISLRHEISYAEGIWVEAVLTHRSGQEMRSGKLPVPHCDGDMQALGSGLTYARRYTANAVLGICPEEDDDGQLTAPGSDNPFRDQANARGAKRRQAAPRGAKSDAPPAEAPKKARDPLVAAQKKFVEAADPIAFDLFLKHCQDSEKLKADLPLYGKILHFAGNNFESRKSKGQFKRDDPAVLAIDDRLKAIGDTILALEEQAASAAGVDAPAKTTQPGMF